MRWPSADDTRDKIVGVWKLDAFVLENVDTKERQAVFGEKPKGYMVITPERFTAILTAEERKAPQTDDERLANFRTLIAYTGPYTIDGNALTTKVEAAWTEAWAGTDQVRYFKLEGDKLSIETAPMPRINHPEEITKGILEWSRAE